MGIIAIFFGLILMVFPFFSQMVLSTIVGVGILILGLYFVFAGGHLWSFNKWGSLAYLLIGILGFIFGIMMIGNVAMFGALVAFYFYLTGFMMILVGFVGIFARFSPVSKGGSILMLVLGIITLVLGYFSLLNPLYVSIIIGISLIFDGITVFMGSDDYFLE